LSATNISPVLPALHQIGRGSHGQFARIGSITIFNT
jgi:hypothetical protein